jgi:hypothetical protein
MFGNTDAGKDSARRTGGCVKAWSQTVDDDDGHKLRYFAPLLPAMETPQIVCAHNPNESDPRAASQQPRYRIVGVSRLNDTFETSDVDAGVTCECTCGSDSLRQGSETTGVFEWVSRGDQPPHSVKPESLEREQGSREMGLMRRIKGSAKQADPHAGRMRGQEALGSDGGLGFHGRV